MKTADTKKLLDDFENDDKTPFCNWLTEITNNKQEQKQNEKSNKLV